MTKADDIKSVLAFAPSILVFTWLLAKLSWFWRHRPDLRFGWVLLCLLGYVVWEKCCEFGGMQRRLGRGPIGRRGRGLVTYFAAAMGFTLLFAFQIYQAAFGLNAASMLGLGLGAWCIISANANHVFGPAAALQASGLMALLFLSFPLPSVLHSLLIGGLQSTVAALSVEMLGAIGIPAERLGNIIRIGRDMVGVDEACSGIRSLQSSVIAGWFVGRLVLGTGAGKLILFLSAIGAGLCGNIIRSMALAWCVHKKGEAIAADWHDTIGWLAFACILGMIGAFSALIARTERKTTSRLPDHEQIDMHSGPDCLRR